MTSNSLWILCEQNFFPLNLECGSETRRQYRYALNDWGRVLGHVPNIDDLTDDALRLWIREMLDRQPRLSKWTINERVGRVKTLWNWLARRGVVKTFPTVKRIPVPDPTPKAWLKDELSRLFESAEQEQGTICGIPAGCWWSARIGFHWYSGERKGAVDALKWDWVDLFSEYPAAVIPADVRKGRKKNGIYQLPAPLVDLLKAILNPVRELVFPQEAPTMYWHYWNRILKRANLPVGPKSKTKALRISHASWLDHEGENATESLMHGDSATTKKFYIDPRLRKSRKPLFDPCTRPAG